MWETGRSKPDADTLIKLAQYFDCTTDYLLGLSEYRNAEHESNVADAFNDIASALEGDFMSDIASEFLSDIGGFFLTKSEKQDVRLLKNAYLEVISAAFDFLTSSILCYEQGDSQQAKTMAYAVASAFSNRFESIFGASEFEWNVRFIPSGSSITAQNGEFTITTPEKKTLKKSTEPTLYRVSNVPGLAETGDPDGEA